MVNPADLRAANIDNLIWRKSSFTANNGQCVEVADIPGLTAVAIRDSKNTGLPAARVSVSAWSAFLRALATEQLSAHHADPALDGRTLPSKTQPLEKAELYAVDLSDVTWLAAPGSNPEDRVEISYFALGAVALRDPAHADLRYTDREWDAFRRGVLADEFA
ncbi:DUF397 domain-containing protein [Sphaerisporangium album]|uniref:DUF397 domain-containing protein n=1 Tax=Sphaerisporangium album TaxID=509200 RepID=UPI001C68FBEC